MYGVVKKKENLKNFKFIHNCSTSKAYYLLSLSAMLVLLIFKNMFIGNVLINVMSRSDQKIE